MQCKFIKPDGTQCNANAMSGLDYCYTHNPDISDEEKREARKKGGSNRAVVLKAPLPVIPIKKIPDVALLIVDTIDRVRAGEMDTRIANCLFIGSDKLMRALEVSELEKRFEELENKVNKQQ